MNYGEKKSTYLGEQFEQGFNQKNKCDQINIQSNKVEQFEQTIDQALYFDLEDINLLETFETCDENQIFENKFQQCHYEACILICNCINQNTKPNVRAILSKGDKFLLVTELQNDTEQYLKKYKENLIKVVNNFIKQNTPSNRSLNKFLGNNEEDDISDNIFNNIDMLRIKIKEINKLM
ncbi:hypothetical protein pb186bvf_000279 [Paramecium bursaria]